MFAAPPARFGRVLADLSMPGLTGAELIRELRIRPELPSVPTSGAHDLFGSSAAEAPDFVRLSKPFRRTNSTRRCNGRSLKAKTRRSGERREDFGETWAEGRGADLTSGRGYRLPVGAADGRAGG